MEPRKVKIEDIDLSILPQAPFSYTDREKIFKDILRNNPDERQPEFVKIESIAQMFQHDYKYAISCLAKWKNKEKAERIITNIDRYFEQIKDTPLMSFSQHSKFCFYLCALMSDIPIDKLEHEYDKHLETMVYGVIHPEGHWSIKTELENQDYSKFICHVSKTGLLPVKTINHATCFRIDENSEFVGIRFLAVPCGEEDLEFDGVREMVVDGEMIKVRSLEILKHDLIHAAFLKFHLQKDPEKFKQRFYDIGMLFEAVYNDPQFRQGMIDGVEYTLSDDAKKLLNKVEAALFFFLHEHTTSIYVDGLPNALPRKYKRMGNIYSNPGQVHLRTALKFGTMTPLFINEIDVEFKLLEHLQVIVLSAEKKQNLSDHDKLVMIMNALDAGYAYLEQYRDIFDCGRNGYKGKLVQRVFRDAFHGLTHFFDEKFHSNKEPLNNVNMLRVNQTTTNNTNTF